jgi:ribose-phosphate pyrophosphokinase
MATEFTDAGIRSIRSTCSVPHPTNAIPLDDFFAIALGREINGQSFQEIPK